MHNFAAKEACFADIYWRTTKDDSSTHSSSDKEANLANVHKRTAKYDSSWCISIFGGVIQAHKLKPLSILWLLIEEWLYSILFFSVNVNCFNCFLILAQLDIPSCLYVGLFLFKVIISVFCEPVLNKLKLLMGVSCIMRTTLCIVVYIKCMCTSKITHWHSINANKWFFFSYFEKRTIIKLKYEQELKITLFTLSCWTVLVISFRIKWPGIFWLDQSAPFL